MLTDYQQLLFLPNTTALSSIRKDDAKQAFVFNAGTFEWITTGPANGTTIFAASGSGFWARKIDGTPTGGGGGGQASIQFQDEGVSLGTAGAITGLNFTGSGVSASIVGTVVTVNVVGGGGGSGYATSADLAADLGDEVGTGYVVFNNAPNFTGNVGFGAPSAGSLVEITNNALGSTGFFPNAGISLVNNSPATGSAANQQQNTPGIRFSGAGWKTNATAGSQSTDFLLYVTQTSGAANPLAYFGIYSSIAGGAYSVVFYVTSAGTANFTGPVTGVTALSLSQAITSSSPAGVVTLQNTGYNTSTFHVRLGSFAIQAYAVNNCWVGDNVRHNGTTFVAVTTGTGSQLYFQTGDLLFSSAPSVTSGTAFVLTQRFKIIGTNGNIIAGNVTDNTVDRLQVDGSLNLVTAGGKVKIATGTNASVGVSAAMTAGTITISTTAVTASSRIFLTHATIGGTAGVLSVGTIVAGTSFVINSSNSADTGTISWWIIN
jgi:hypothetical protein